MTAINVSPQDGFRIGILLPEIESGSVPDKAAAVLREKTAEIRELNDFLESMLDAPPMLKQSALLDVLEHPGKTLASGLDKSTSAMRNLAVLGGVTGAGLLGLSALPLLAGTHAGRALGGAAGTLSADIPATSLEDLSRLEEIDTYRQAADEVMRRIRRADKKKLRKQIPSARTMF